MFSLIKILLVSILCVFSFIAYIRTIRIKFNVYDEILVNKNNFSTDRPIPEKQGRVRGNKNISKVGLNTTIPLLPKSEI